MCDAQCCGQCFYKGYRCNVMGLQCTLTADWVLLMNPCRRRSSTASRSQFMVQRRWCPVHSQYTMQSLQTCILLIVLECDVPPSLQCSLKQKLNMKWALKKVCSLMVLDTPPTKPPPSTHRGSSMRLNPSCLPVQCTSPQHTDGVHIGDSLEQIRILCTVRTDMRGAHCCWWVMGGRLGDREGSFRVSYTQFTKL